MTGAQPTIGILGASGLIGQAVAESLAQQGYRIVAVARRFTEAQAAAFGPSCVVSPIAELSVVALTDLLRTREIDIVMNCLGVLQDGARGRTQDVHELFVEHLLDALATHSRPTLLIHLSIPGSEADDPTPFSQTKRAGEARIAASPIPHVILRPGFVIAPAAYGGSALVRALAAMPVRLPAAVAERPFAITAVGDITRTVACVADRWAAGERRWACVWDVMARQPTTVSVVVETFRHRFGGPRPWVSLPGWLLTLGARAGDGAGALGWTPPVRATALAEMMRGVSGDPGRWMADTGLDPLSLDGAVAAVPATVQEIWFARLYLLKGIVIPALAVFWLMSGLNALLFAFRPATAILTTHGVPLAVAEAATLVTSLFDIAIGLAIAWRRSCRMGLLAGVGLALGYMVLALIITPDLWIDPLGGLVKTGPAIILMLVALLILPER